MKVTIVTVTFNVINDLEKTIQSILSQTHLDIEYIIIDGGSQDGTVDIIRKYEQYISYWVSEPDHGIYDAMNKGIDAATGEWINFMNAGDSFADKDALKHFLKDVKDDTMLYCGAINFIDESTGVVTYRKPHTNQKVWQTIAAWHQGTFIKTSLMKEYKYSLHYKIAGDHEFFVRCYVDGLMFQFVDNVVANMVAGGIHQQQNKLAYIESMKILADYAPSVDMVYESNFCKSFFYNRNELPNYALARKINLLLEQTRSLKDIPKLAIYGYGSVAKLILNELDNVVVAVDRDFLTFQSEKIDVVSLDMFTKKGVYDAVLITVLGREIEIKTELIRRGIPAQKIIEFTL